MRTTLRTSLSMLIVLVAAVACVVPNVTIVDPIAQATMLAQTVDAAVRGTREAAGTPPASSTPGPSPTASETPTPTLSPTPTLTNTSTLTTTPVVIASMTPVVPSISVSVPTNCRSGPGKAYPIEGALLVGQIAQVLARDPTSSYFYIPNPDSAGDYCWVWNGYATLSGNTGLLPIYTPPPTPTASMTPTPEPGFDASYDGLVGCTGSWWTEITLENTSQLTFRSIEFTLRDLELDVTVSDTADGFVDRPNCSSSISKVSLLPGKSLIVSSPALDNDPDGHNMRATITLCTQTGQKGTCVTEVIRFKP